jgi:hypothetical protein|tara:strand:+ start:472 stop:651 length:180 start_codon:yes stop_codon:yes gene_type:complete
MMQDFSTYILIGLIWCLITDLLMTEMEDNWTRVRYILFWPITFGAFIYGFIESIINHNK